MAPKVAIVYYSMYGHIKTLADAELKGIESSNGTAKLYQYVPLHFHSISSTLSLITLTAL